jgi:hypothetical protein
MDWITRAVESPWALDDLEADEDFKLRRRERLGFVAGMMTDEGHYSLS